MALEITCKLSTENQVKSFESLKLRLGTSDPSKILKILLNSFWELQNLKREFHPELTSEEIELLYKAAEVSDLEVFQIIKRGVIAEAKTVISLAKRQTQLSKVKPEELKHLTFRGVAFARIDRVIRQTMQHNTKVTKKQDKFFISEYLIFKLTNSNRKALKEYFETYQSMIDSHNQKYGLTSTDNRKGKGIDVKKMLKL